MKRTVALLGAGLASAALSVGLTPTGLAAASSSHNAADSRMQTPTDVIPKKLTLYASCKFAPPGAMAIDYESGWPPDRTDCWSGFGRVDNPNPSRTALQLHSGGNHGFVTVADPGIHDVPFAPNQTINFPQGTTIRVVALNE